MGLVCIIEEPAWAVVDPETLAQRCFDAARAMVPTDALSRETTALFTSDDAVRDLNARWRGKDKATNVLSFPADPVPGLPPEVQPLGDLALAYQTCADEAADKGISMNDHAAHLVVHGLLHLLGYDHVADDEAEFMEDLERQVLKRMGIADPYGEAPV